jgi:hypothetical protein
MKNNLEKGGYLSGQEGRIEHWAAAALLLLIAAGYVGGNKRSAEWDRKVNEFVTPQGASEVLEPVARRQLTLVYEGQKEPKCPGDIEKVVPMKDENGTFRALNVICKPNTAEPAK